MLSGTLHILFDYYIPNRQKINRRFIVFAGLAVKILPPTFLREVPEALRLPRMKELFGNTFKYEIPVDD